MTNFAANRFFMHLNDSHCDMLKKTFSLLVALMLEVTVLAQTMNVVVGDVVYQFPAAQTGDMSYSEGTELTVLGKTFTISDINKIYVDEAEVHDNTVKVSYDGATAKVYVAGNVARYITPTVSGAHVSIAQSTEVGAGNVGEITYSLTGTSNDGEFYLTGSYKCTVELNGVTLVNQTPVYSGAAVNIQNGKRIDISVKKDTENHLTDAASGEQTACLVVKGHAEFKGKGTLNVYGQLKHGIKTSDYMSVKNCTINVLSAVADGVNVNEYFLMESGVLAISSVGDDGLQVELDGTASTGETNDHEDEDSGNVYLQGGTLTATVTAAATKGIKADGSIYITDGIIDVTTTGGGAYDSTEKDAKGCSGLSADGDITVHGGTLTLKSTGAGGKCIKCDGTLTVTDGIISATSTGSKYRYSNNYTASAKAIKAGVKSGSGWNFNYSGGIVISGGDVTAKASSHEAIESKNTIDISGGHVSATSSDDAINSASTFTISGGYVMGYSTGNDGLDANGNFYIKGGVVYAIGTRQPEVGIDANTEGGYKLYVEGGTIVAIAGLENNSSLTQSCYSASSWNKNAWYALYNNGELALAFKTPASGGNTLVVSTSGTTTLKSGVTVTDGTEYFTGMGNIGGTVSGGSSVTLSSYTGGGGHGPGPGPGPGPGGW